MQQAHCESAVHLWHNHTAGRQGTWKTERRQGSSLLLDIYPQDVQKTLTLELWHETRFVRGTCHIISLKKTKKQVTYRIKSGESRKRKQTYIKLCKAGPWCHHRCLWQVSHDCSHWGRRVYCHLNSRARTGVQWVWQGPSSTGGSLSLFKMLIFCSSFIFVFGFISKILHIYVDYWGTCLPKFCTWGKRHTDLILVPHSAKQMEKHGMM